MTNNKKLYGQFFTTINPFNIDIFYKWFDLIPENKKKILLEPFAGSNNIVKMIQDLKFTYEWHCYDINPGSNCMPKFPIKERDTIKDFPKGYYVTMTNPPYLAKNSATKRKFIFPNTHYDDLYKICLDVMLKNLEYVAAIIPESFINANIFQNRLYSFISLTCKMFDDTECPVCLALFIPESQKEEINLETEDFYVYRQNEYIGNYKELKEKIPKSTLNINWKFNDPNGSIGIRCVDGTIEPNIKFIKGSEIDKTKIKVSSRSITRVSGLPANINLEEFINRCNKELIKYRTETEDLFFTCFKGLRKDGKYRRRLDFANAKLIMNSVIEEMKEF